MAFWYPILGFATGTLPPVHCQNNLAKQECTFVTFGLSDAVFVYFALLTISFQAIVPQAVLLLADMEPNNKAPFLMFLQSTGHSVHILCSHIQAIGLLQVN